MDNIYSNCSYYCFWRGVYIDNWVQDVTGEFCLCLQLAAYGNGDWSISDAQKTATGIIHILVEISRWRKLYNVAKYNLQVLPQFI